MGGKVQLKAAVSTRALVQRINRKLREDDQVVKATRGGVAEQDLGYYYILDVRRRAIDAHHVNLETLGREIGVLRSYEEWDTGEK